MRDPDDDNEAEMKTPRPNQILLCLSASVITFESLPIKLIIIIGHQTIFLFSFYMPTVLQFPPTRDSRLPKKGPVANDDNDLVMMTTHQWLSSFATKDIHTHTHIFLCVIYFSLNNQEKETVGWWLSVEQ